MFSAHAAAANAGCRERARLKNEYSTVNTGNACKGSRQKGAVEHPLADPAASRRGTMTPCGHKRGLSRAGAERDVVYDITSIIPSQVASVRPSP